MLSGDRDLRQPYLTDRDAKRRNMVFPMSNLRFNRGDREWAGLTMSTLDLIGYYGQGGKLLDVGGGAESERVMHAVRLVGSVPR